MLLAIGGDILNGLLPAGDGVGEGDGAEVCLCLHSKLLLDHTAVIAAANGHKTHRRGVGDDRAGFNVIERTARFGGHGGNIVGMHMPGKNITHARVGKRRAQAFIVIDQVHGQQLRLHGEVGDVAMVLQADNRVAAGFSGSDLLQNPFFQVRADSAAGLMLVQAAVGIIRAVTGRINGDHRVALCRAGSIGEAARFLSLRWGIGGDDALIPIGHLVVNLLKILRLRAPGRHRGAVLGVKVHGVGVAQVVVARYNINLKAGNGLLQGLQPRRERFMPLLFPVLGQVAGDHQHIGLIGPDSLQHLFQNRRALGKHFPVAVQMLRVIGGVLNHIRREIMCV